MELRLVGPHDAACMRVVLRWTSMARPTKTNFEEWDFRHIGHDDPDYDAAAELFLSQNYTTAVAVDTMRLTLMEPLLDQGLLRRCGDGEHLELTIGGGAASEAAFLHGMKGPYSRFRRDDRFTRSVIASMSREYKKSGKLRVTILPR
jgi:hypothetical protein